MTLQDICAAMVAKEELEYHLMGVEKNAALIGNPGWYSVLIDSIAPNGDVECSFTSPDLDKMSVTVMKKNIPIAFRTI